MEDLKRNDEQTDDEIRQLIIEGCEDMAEIYLEMEKEFHPLEEEAAIGFYSRQAGQKD